MIKRLTYGKCLKSTPLIQQTFITCLLCAGNASSSRMWLEELYKGKVWKPRGGSI